MAATMASSRRAVAWAAALLAAILAVPLPGLAQSEATITVEATGSDAVTVDLRADAGKVLAFRLDEADFAKAKDATSFGIGLLRTGSSDRLTYAGVRDSSHVWTATIPVDTIDLVAGSWLAQYFVVGPHAGPTDTGAANDRGGSATVKQRGLTVTLSDTAAPMLEVLPFGDPIRLGPGDAIEITVEEDFLRAVTIQHAGLPQPVALQAPYHLSVSSLPEGVTNVTVRASDRAGQVSEAAVRIDRDTVAPRLAVSAPEVAYTGVPFAILADTVERSQHTVRLQDNGTVETRNVAASPSEATAANVFVVTADEVGTAVYTVEAIDLMGNRVSAQLQVPIVQPPTDVRAVSVGLEPGAAPFAGHAAHVVATIEQVGGVTALPVVVTFATAGQQQAFTVTVPAAGPKLVEWNVSLPAGPRQVTVHVESPSFANETDPGNQDASATIETFLGSARAGGDRFLIRADSRGLPAQAVQDGGTKTYPLVLVQTGRGVVYEFTLAGNVTGTWDPLDPRAGDAEPEPAEDDDSSSSSTDGSKGAPAPGLVIALLVVALAALVQRRKA
jgi:MYXO-CTERM domain-containing protein